jgi:predicted nucleic acid-binding protein
VGYAAAYNAARPATDHLLAFLRALPVAIREPRHPRFTSERAARAICFGVVGWMLRRYELEVADLFHIALAGLDGTNAIAGLDKGYRDVDGIIVYTCV